MAESKVLIIGLGNPGSRYEKTRHNAGFLAVDSFAEEVGVSVGTEKMKGLYCSFRLAGKKVFLLKPMNFMNRSGECAALFARYFSVDSGAILVVHDDLDVSPGHLKIVSSGGAGGHNGIRSLISHLGTRDFARLKIGIGHPRDKEETRAMPVERFVLSRFPENQWHEFQENLSLVRAGIRLFITDGQGAAMNRVNKKPERLS